MSQSEISLPCIVMSCPRGHCLKANQLCIPNPFILGMEVPVASCASSLVIRVAGAFQVYSPIRGAVWDSRAAIFCPTEPPKCLEVQRSHANLHHPMVKRGWYNDVIFRCQGFVMYSIINFHDVLCIYPAWMTHNSYAVAPGTGF